ncbi:phage holin [Staphylococcus epidermidis]|uniref:phage holin n=1 Tax=Staphylococcus epidermidis TaxID=1282 RepID=UPI0002432E77|nr:phage holin [Staphylococcus epidermidis]EHM72897.1 holin, SPP1 family [Staphylococcus epidermidis 14.1.R1.SE]APT17135.1 phage holin [Staphylococcus epidermidis]MCG1062961.1 phage holin [Staphylococcus epidermidis]MCG2396273.1 phage holin [Staphylococcus epidermidis]MCG2403939.1 phage holin [Staphylococcus epidermidis]
MKTDVGSIVRTIVFILAWVNQFLATKHISPIPVDEVTISSIITGAISLWTWWKNNNFSHAAQKGQQKLHEVKAGTENTNGKAPIGGNDL